MSIALRIEPMNDSYTYDSAIDFDDTEVLDVNLYPANESVVQQSQKQYPQVYDRSKALAKSTTTDKKIIEVTLYHSKPDTKTNVELLFGYGVIFKVYYRYASDASAMVYCILDPNYEDVYFYGEQAAEITTNLKFYETYATL